MQTSVRAGNLTLVLFKRSAFQHGHSPQSPISSSSSGSILSSVAKVSPFHRLVPSPQPLWRALIVSKLDAPNGRMHVDQQDMHVMHVLNEYVGAESCMRNLAAVKSHMTPTTIINSINESSYRGCLRTCRNSAAHKYGGGVFTHGLLWNHRRLRTVAFNPKSQVLSGTKCEADETSTDEGILAVWDCMLSCDRSTLLKLAPSLIKLSLIRMGDNDRDGDLKNTHMDRDPAKTVAFGQRALKVFELHKSSSLEHVSWVYRIARAYQMMGELEKAVEHAEKAASIVQHSKATNDKKDNHAWKTLAILVVCISRLGRPLHESVPYVNKYIKLSEKILKPGDGELGLSYQIGAQAYCEVNQPYDALRCCSKALAIFKQHYGPSSPQVAVIRHIRSKAYLSLGKYKNSLLECEKARPFIDRTIIDVGDVDLVSVECLLDHQEYEKAITRLKEMLKNNPKTSSLHASALIFLARVYGTLERKRRFAKWCTRAVAASGNLEPSLDNGASVRYLGKLQQQQGNNTEALMIMKISLEVYNRCDAKEVAATEVVEIEGEIGLLLLNMGKFDEALPYFENYVIKTRKFHGSDKKTMMELQGHVEMAYSITKDQKMSEELQSRWTYIFADGLCKH